MTRGRWFVVASIGVLALLVVLAILVLGEEKPRPFPEITAELRPLHDPYTLSRLAWEHFLYVNAPRAGNQVEWETWADAGCVFDQSQAPQWPANTCSGNTFLRPRTRPTKQEMLLASQGKPPAAGMNPRPPTEVRMNRTAFVWVRDFSFWNPAVVHDRVTDFLQSGARRQFTKGSVFVKAAWEPLRAGESADTYYIRTVGGATYRLVGLHLASRVFPYWFWATWEHEKNPDRDPEPDDNFGLASGQPSRLLLRWLDSAGMNQWRHYRLIGTQVLFTDALGQPTGLANSKIEVGMTRKDSSCATCHALASVDAAGTRHPLVPWPLVGPPHPDWFRQHMPLDFVWSVVP